MKLAIVGSRSYQNKERMVQIIHYYQIFYNLIEIISGGADGADRLGKEVALQLGLSYVEFAPKHRKWNEFCYQKPEYFGKPYSPSNFFLRNTEIAEYCDECVAFVIQGIPANGTMDTVNKCKMLGKPVQIVEDSCAL